MHKLCACFALLIIACASDEAARRPAANPVNDIQGSEPDTKTVQQPPAKQPEQPPQPEPEKPAPKAPAAEGM